MDLAIVKYNAGNIQSVLYALERIGATATVTDDHRLLKKAGKVIFPGVGEASSAMRFLREKNLDTVLKQLEQPVLGICLGMQLMCAWSEENNTPCLGIFGETVKQFRPVDHSLKVPQIGWNTISSLQTPLFTGIPENSYCYFVHGYYAALGNETIAVTDYVQPYSSALQHGNFYGVQFHPEKSAKVGEQILKNFLAL